jgi:hypothetical protein
MHTIMGTPSYAAPTTSSALKTKPHPSLDKIPSTKLSSQPTPTLKELKRPSTLTSHQRLSIAQNTSLHPIKPHDPSKPCPLATLPSELRLEVYEYIIGITSATSQPGSLYLPRTSTTMYDSPAILKVCKAIRIEAAYVYYALTPLEFTVRNLDFKHILNWLRCMPASHRALLARNRRLTITILSSLRHTHTYPPVGWLLDAHMDTHWKATRAFGKMYTLRKSQRINFILFARLMTWFRVNSTSMCRGMRWCYVFETGSSMRWERSDPATDLLEFARERLLVLGTDCVQKAWTRGQMKETGQEEAMLFVSDLDRCFRRVSEGCGGEVLEEWEALISRLRKTVEQW